MVLAQDRVVALASHTVLIGKDGMERLIADSAAPIKSRDGTIEGVVLVFRDITEAAEAKRQIRHLHLHDKLTGLLNRKHFEDMLRRLNKRRNLPFSLIIGDVNGLRLVNDAFGHQEGDKLLVAMANVLKESCRKDDLVARWGGDEFAVLLPRACNRVAKEVCERIRQACKDAGSGLVQLSIALGYATKNKIEQSVEQLLKEAEETMYTNKLRESNSIRNSIIASLKRSLFETDYETEEHTRRLEELAIRMGKVLNLADSQLDQLVLLASLHDIGKIAIPKEILMKTEPLSMEEWDTLKKHLYLHPAELHCQYLRSLLLMHYLAQTQ
jgi:diguanylate cyclase (GGDEF)-like protein